jgi:hypothetical protein
MEMTGDDARPPPLRTPLNPTPVQRGFSINAGKQTISGGLPGTISMARSPRCPSAVETRGVRRRAAQRRAPLYSEPPKFAPIRLVRMEQTMVS